MAAGRQGEFHSRHGGIFRKRPRTETIAVPLPADEKPKADRYTAQTKVLLGATARYLPAIIISQAFALGFTALGGWITGEGAA